MNDTIFGINNEGALVFDYYHEDSDKLGSSNVYNGQNSILWDNYKRCFPAKIASTYANLRNNKKLTYEAIIDNYVTNGSDKWSAAIYNADAEYKYLSMAREIQTEGDYAGTVDDSNLYQVRGPGEHHLRYFIPNRLNYCDSKWYAGEYPDDYIFLRIYTPTTVIPNDADISTDEAVAALVAQYGEDEVRIFKSLKAVPATPNITVTPFSDMYAGVKYKANGTLQQQRLKKGETYTFGPPNPETFNDTETGIYGAGELTSLGDLSGLYCGVISLGKASKLTDITIGNKNPDYHNDNFREIRVGSNRLLRLIDLRNCSGLGKASGTSIDSGWGNAAAGAVQTTLDLSGCPNIETVYTEGTNLQTVALPDGGYVKVLHLPKSTKILNIKNQLYLYEKTDDTDGFYVESDDYSNIITLCIENCPGLDTNKILDKCRDANGRYTVERVRLTGIEWSFQDASFVKSLFPKFDEDGNIIGGIRGIDEKNNNTEDAYLVGTCHINELTGADYAEISEHYKWLTITFDKMTSNVTFNYSDADGNAHEEVVAFTSTNSQVGDLTGHVTERTPAWPENDAFTYEFVGWSRKQQISKGVEDSENDYLAYIQADALQKIVGDRVLYPVFKACRKSYPVVFINPTAPEGKQELAVVITPYGNDAVYTGETPAKLNATSPSNYEHTGWHPAPTNITGPTYCYAQFALLDSVWYTLGLDDITYTTNDAAKTLKITKCQNRLNPAIRVPAVFEKDGVDYRTISVKSFSDMTLNAQYENLELLDLPDTLETIETRTFYMCKKLFEITLPAELVTIGPEAFTGCSKITSVHIPAKVSSIGQGAFLECPLETMTVAPENTTFKMVNDCLVGSDKVLVRGLSTGVIPSVVTELLAYCFAYTNITDAEIPDSVTAIPSNAFYRCYQLETVHLPAELVTLGPTCFGSCNKLKNVELPSKLSEIGTYVFNDCAIEHIIIPASVKKLGECSFGNMTSLKTVTFETRYDENGNIIAPYIDHRAFSGCDHVEFNVPWAKDYVYNYTFEGKPYASVDEYQAWGATNYTMNHNYTEA